MKERQLTWVSRRDFDVLQSPGPITRLPGFRKAPRFTPVFFLHSFLPFNSYAEPTLSPVNEPAEAKLRRCLYFFPSSHIFLHRCAIPGVARNFWFPKSMALLLPVYSFYCPRQWGQRAEGWRGGGHLLYSAKICNWSREFGPEKRRQKERTIACAGRK